MYMYMYVPVCSCGVQFFFSKIAVSVAVPSGFNAYHSGANCVWALQSPATNCVALDVSFLVSEAPREELLVYAASGDLLAKFSGRHAWAVVEPRIDALYPRTFDWMCFGGPEGEVIETVPLFGDLIDAARLVVDQADDDDYDGSDLEPFTGFAPATNAQRHILRVAKKGVSLLDILPTLSSPRTPWSTREGTGTQSPNTPGRRSRRLSRAASSGSTEPSTPAVTVDDSAPTSPV